LGDYDEPDIDPILRLLNVAFNMSYTDDGINSILRKEFGFELDH